MANPEFIKSFTAEAAVQPYTIVKFGTADGNVAPAAAATDALLGVAGPVGGDLNGIVDIILDGIAEVKAGGAITRGDQLTSDANGAAVTASPAAGVNNRIIGVAMVSAAAGDIFPVLVEQSVIQG